MSVQETCDVHTRYIYINMLCYSYKCRLYTFMQKLSNSFSLVLTSDLFNNKPSDYYYYIFTVKFLVEILIINKISRSSVDIECCHDGDERMVLESGDVI